MATPPKGAGQANKVVVAYVDRRRLKGYVYNFSALKASFSLFPANDPLQHKGAEVEVKDLKAVFFVKDFLGDPERRKLPPVEVPRHGRKIEVSFADGETLVGTTEGYHPEKLGFFLLPLDPDANNIRIFVVTKNARHIRFL